MSPGSKPNNPKRGFQPPASRHAALNLRAGIIRAIRKFLDELDFLEVETPILISAPAPERHIEPIPASGGFLHTSPELCMKRLLAAGYQRIYQITRCFRAGERGRLHLPEFTMLEWYHAGIDYRELMRECRMLVQSVFMECGKADSIHFAGHTIKLDGQWETLSVAEAFERWAPITLEQALLAETFDLVMVEHIEPQLGTRTPSFIYNYPISMGSLARPCPDNPMLAERFEFYIGGLELANGFSELTDQHEQRKRFRNDIANRKGSEKSSSPMPERFLASLKFMPEAAGIALGVDRLVMVLGDYSEIDEVVAFTPEEVKD
ncbi:MAG: EF-P lysine aminoacylase GenX [Desulfobacteraceae bacterium]|jgi:lysyl-tRNA synthetase class 2|nr:MAG: EF-P lysine aminoacylase GenX [Desulfobacteraceae bacterium]